MLKHELPEFLPAAVGIGSQYKVAIKNRPSTFTHLFAKERVGEDAAADKAYRWFLASLIALYGHASFKRGNLDAGRSNRLFGREIVPLDAASFNAASDEAELRIDYTNALAYLERLG